MSKVPGVHCFQTAKASYWLSANFSASLTVPINYDQKEYDDENCVTTSATAWKYTAKYTGTHEVEIFGYSTSSVNFSIYKNGAFYTQLIFSLASSNGISGIAPVPLNVGEYIDIRPSGSATIVGGTISGANNTNKISVKRIGF